MRPLLSGIAIAPLLFLATACANVNTIDRTTIIPGGSSTKSKSGSAGLAVHLDIQQRLLVVNAAGKFCAEPSPDALAAYAAAVGISASKPAAGALAAAASGQSSAASIGLRTQSITLMRDAMFRMCEAYANGKIGDAQVATLLARSQDLTAVILAVEQLTGPAIASQASISSSAQADATASALANGDQVALVGKRLDRDRKSSAVADDDLITKTGELDSLKIELAGENAKLEELKTAASQAAAPAAAGTNGTAVTVANAGTTPAAATTATPSPETAKEIALAEARVAALGKRQMALETSVEIATAEAARRKAALEQTETFYQTLLEKQDAAIANVATETSGSANVVARGSTSKLDDGASKEIAKAVSEIVTTVLKKDYVLEGCMSIVTTNDTQFESTRERCFRLIEAVLIEREKNTNARIEKISKRRDILEKVATDETNLEKVQRCMAQPAARKKIIGAISPAAKDSGFLADNVLERWGDKTVAAAEWPILGESEKATMLRALDGNC